MYNWEEGPYVDELDHWEDLLSEEYDKFIRETCKCSEDCECMTFEQFKDRELERIEESYEMQAAERYEEMYG